MSNTNMKVALEIVVNDRGSREAGQAVSAIAQKNHEAARQQQRDAATVAVANARYSDQSRRASVVLAQQQMAASRSASSRVLRDAERLHSARAQLGIRSERSLQREIIQTAIAYRRLEESGRVSGRELARAAEAAQHKVRMLQREMRQLKTPSEWGKGLAAIGAGIAAGVAVAKRPLSETMAYDQQVATISNTAYASEGVEGRKQGQRLIDEVITQSVRKGGTREEAADALDGLLSKMPREEAFTILPTVQQTALAAGMKSRDIVPLVGALRANGIPVAEMPAALGKMIHAGENGGYGVKNMVQSMPRLLDSLRQSGLSGMQGLEVVLADMHAITAGTNMPEESAQSLTSLVEAIKQPAVAQAVAKKLSINGEHVDLAATVGQGVLQGVSPLETLTATIDKAMVNNKEYKRLKGRLEKGGSPADQDQMATLLETTVFRDLGISRKAMLAITGYMSQRDTVAGLRGEYAGAGVQALETSSAVMMDTASEKVNQANQTVADARHRALQPITEAMGDVAKKITEYAQTYPELTSAIVGATDGIKVMTAAAIAFGGVKALTGAGAGVGVGATVSGFVSSAAGFAGRLSRVLARAAPLVATAAAGYEMVQTANSDLPDDQKKVAYTRTTASTAGGMGGAYAGASAFSWLGPWGMVGGGILGGLLGYRAGDEFGDEVGNSWFSPGRSTPPKGVVPKLNGEDLKGLHGLRKELVNAWRESHPKIEVKVELDGREIAASVNEHNAREARRD